MVICGECDHENIDAAIYCEECGANLSREVDQQEDDELRKDSKPEIDESTQPIRVTQSEIKICPYCAETIKKAAIVCRYCGRELEPDKVRLVSQQIKPSIPIPKQSVPVVSQPKPVWQETTTETERTTSTSQVSYSTRKKKPKTWLWVILLVLLVVLYNTNPSEHEHQSAVAVHVGQVAGEEVAGDLGRFLGGFIGRNVGNIASSLNLSIFDYQSYWICSTLSYDGQLITFGVFNKIYIITPIQEWKNIPGFDQFIPDGSTDTRIRVSATSSTPTGIYINKGDQLSFSATGTWCWGGSTSCSSPAGTTGRPGVNERQGQISNEPYGKLIGQIGHIKFPIGEHSTMQFDVSGDLVLLMNDWEYRDNTGFVDVVISKNH